ncbi:hypothetical protein PoB_001473400 [Plakobranchus ocellatus]|uniref:Uncharacterized protein n=1 Tax=Plakobranchus ocellatus TaxID=259542 RepID=A0AAV3YYX0_9GAST|nr:hypothetical protein PoB_001473400 [Plakobranchus ocellatus]
MRGITLLIYLVNRIMEILNHTCNGINSATMSLSLTATEAGSEWEILISIEPCGISNPHSQNGILPHSDLCYVHVNESSLARLRCGLVAGLDLRPANKLETKPNWDKKSL